MNLTEQQKQTLKAYILADPVLSTKVSGPSTDYAFISAALNTQASPDFYLWRSTVSPAELRDAVMVGAVQLDGLTAAKRDSLLWAINVALDFRVAANRAAIDDFCGSQNTLKSALQAVQKRLANLAEKILATGIGSAASPAIAGAEGTIGIGEIGGILAS